jgi:hypothetical protein
MKKKTTKLTTVSCENAGLKCSLYPVRIAISNWNVSRTRKEHHKLINTTLLATEVLFYFN